MNLVYYVYVLVDPRDGMPFYVGKGRNGRMISHVCEAKKPKSQWTNPIKCNKINRILKLGHEVEYVQRYCQSAEQALSAEQKLISLFGRISNGTGVLTNISDGGEVAHPKTKVVYEYDITGAYLRTHASVTAAAEMAGTHPSNITRAIYGRDIIAIRSRYYRLEKTDTIVIPICAKVKIVQQFTLSGDLVAQYNGTTKASIATGISVGSIRACCRGEVPNPRNFMFKYKETK